MSRPCRATEDLRLKQLSQDRITRRLKYQKDETNRLKRLAQNRDWKKANPDKIRVTNLNRIARQKEAEGSFTFSDIEFLLAEQGNRCPGCLQLFTEELPPTVDHFIPLIKGGTNFPDNLQLMCGPCNSSKKASLWNEWKNFG